MVEFAAVLLPVLLIVVGIVQFGLLFGANVTLTNAAREAARAATITPVRPHLHPRDKRRHALHGRARCRSPVLRDPGRRLAALRRDRSVPRRNRPQRRRYPRPLGERRHDRDPVRLDGDAHERRARRPGRTARPTDPAGCLVQVRLTYRSDIVVPFMGALLPARRERALRPARDDDDGGQLMRRADAARADARDLRRPPRPAARIRGRRHRRRPRHAPSAGMPRPRRTPGPWPPAAP